MCIATTDKICEAKTQPGKCVGGPGRWKLTLAGVGGVGRGWGGRETQPDRDLQTDRQIDKHTVCWPQINGH